MTSPTPSQQMKQRRVGPSARPSLAEASPVICPQDNNSEDENKPESQCRAKPQPPEEPRCHRRWRAAALQHEINPQCPEDKLSWQHVAARTGHTCAIDSEGFRHSWGRGGDNELQSPEGTFTEISAGRHSTCAIHTNSEVACWGKNNKGAGTPTEGQLISVGIDTWHACGVKTDGSIQCWGGDSCGNISQVPTGQFIEVSVDPTHSCARDRHGDVTCWGTCASSAVGIPDLTFSALDSGGVHHSGDLGHIGFSCGLDLAGQANCLGQQQDPTLDRIGPPCTGGPLQDDLTSKPNLALSTVSTGNHTACGLDLNGRNRCWGTTDFNASNAPAGTYVRLSVGTGHGCAVTLNGEKTCSSDSTK